MDSIFVSNENTYYILKLKLNTGIEEERARDLFYAIWIPDLFMKRVEEDGDWSFMCPINVLIYI